MASLSKELPRLISVARVEGYVNEINSHASMTKVSLHVGGYWHWLDLEKDGFYQVHLLMNE